MSLYITIDGGTTNTRVSLVKNKEIIDTIKINVGARKGMGNKDILKAEIKNAIDKLLKQNHISESDVIRILASGMITSEFGLYNLEHIKAPAGIDELHDSMEEVDLNEITTIPFVFIRGVKTVADNFENIDIMRGEETELMGMVKPDYGKCVYVLPGSHSKIISTDDSGKISGFSTMLTGEMIEALSQHTILKDAVDLSVCEINSEYLLKGYDYCRQQGINKAVFKTRVLKNACGCEKDEAYSFFIGTILCNEIEYVAKCDAETIVIGGKAQIKNAMAEILKNRSSKKIISLDEDRVNCSTALGAIKIFERDK